LSGPRRRTRFDEMQANPIEQASVPGAHGSEDVRSEPSVARTGFNQVDCRLSTVDRRLTIVDHRLSHLDNLDGEKLAEEGPDVDAGKKLARTARSLGRAGVIPDRWIVKGKVHERGHRHRAAFANPINDAQCFATLLGPIPTAVSSP